MSGKKKKKKKREGQKDATSNHIIRVTSLKQFVNCEGYGNFKKKKKNPLEAKY